MGLSELRNLHFLHPKWLAALPLLWAYVVWQWRRQRREGGWSRVIDPDLLTLLRLPGGRGQSPWWIVTASWTLAVVALAGVTWEHEQSTAYHSPSDWILIMDLSPSMAVADVPPDRATRARYVISDFLNAAEDTRVALVVFAGEAHTVAPLTTDVSTVRALLPPLAPNIMPEGGDDLAPALDEAARLIENAGSRRPEIVVLSDGISDPAHALESAQRLRAHGARIDVIGIGTERGAPVPLKAGGFELDARGNPVVSKLDADQLKRIAAAGGGEYLPEASTHQLIAQMQQLRTYQAQNNSSDQTEHVMRWRNDGIWLLPLLLLCVPLLARRGWL